MANEREVKLKISTDTDGKEKIQALRTEVDQLIKSGGDGAPVYKKFAEELDAISRQQDLTVQFSELAAKTRDLVNANREVTAEIEKNSTAVRERRNELSQAITQERAAAESVAALKEAQKAAEIGMRSAKAEIDAYRAAIAKAGEANKDQANGIEQAKIQYREYVAQLSAARTALDQSTPAYNKTTEALRAAQSAFDSANETFKKNRETASTLSAEYESTKAALADVKQAMSGTELAGKTLSAAQVSISESVSKVAQDLREEQAAMLAAATAEKQKAETLRQVDAAYRELTASLKADAQLEVELINLAKAQNQINIESAKSALSLAKIEGDANTIRQAKINLVNAETRASQLNADLLRSEAAAAEKLLAAKLDYLQTTNRTTAATETETSAERAAINTKLALAEATETAAKGSTALASNIEKSKSGLSTLGTVTEFAVGKLVALYALFQSMTGFAKVNFDLENVNRTLVSVTGNTELARKEMQFISETSNRLGLELVSTAKAYAQFSTSTKGSVLEGEQTRKIFTAVAQSMSIAGKSAADTEGALNALGQMVSKNNVQMEELRGQLGDRLPRTMSIVAESTGLTTAQLIKMVESGKMLATDMLPAMADALIKTNKEMVNLGSTSEQEWNRFKNSATSTVGQLGESGVIKTGIQTLNSISATVTGLAGGFAILIASVTAFSTASGQSINSFAKSLISLDFTGFTKNVKINFQAASDTVIDWTNSVAVAYNRFAENTNGLIAPIKLVGKQTTDTTTVIKGMGDQSVKSSDAATAANDKVVKSSAELGAEWVKLNGRYEDYAKSLNDSVLLAEKHVAAVEAQAKSESDLAKATGDATRERQAEYAGSLNISKALEDETKQRSAALFATQEQITKLQELVANSKTENSEHTKQIEDLKKLAATREEELEKIRAKLQLSKLATEQAYIESQTIQDNSSKLEGLRAVYQLVSAQVADLTRQKREGQNVDAALIETQARLASASRLYADALADTTRLIAAKSQQVKSENDLAQMTVRLAIEEAKSNAEVARVKGDEAGARRANNEVRRLEIQLAQLQAQALRSEAEATIETIKIKREEITARRELTAAEEAEFKAGELGAQVKKKQADIADETAKRLERLTTATAGNTSATTSNTSATSQAVGPNDNLTSSNNNLANSYDKVANSANSAAAAKRNAIPKNSDGTSMRETTNSDYFVNKDGKVVDKNGQTGNASDGYGMGQKDANLANLLYDFMHGVDIAKTAENLALARTELQAATANLEMMQRNSGAYSSASFDSTRAAYNRARALVDALSGSGIAGVRSSTQGSGSPGGLNTYTVTINLGSSSTNVNVASEKDAQALTGILSQISSAKARG